MYFVNDVETGTIKLKMVARLTPEQGTFLIAFDKNGQIKRSEEGAKIEFTIKYPEKINIC